MATRTNNLVRGRPPLGTAFQTSLGRMVNAELESVLDQKWIEKLHGRVQLLLTSPPFPLNTKKSYGNLTGERYRAWLAAFASSFAELLTPDGSIVIELGNAWEPGLPAMSTLAIESLLDFKAEGEFVLCQEFIWHNPSRLPTPAQWVNIERIRVKDSFTRFWWLAKTPRPKADNRRVLVEYSDAMKALLKRGSYNSGPRPSEHSIGEDSFVKDNGGAIPPNVLTISNTRANDPYLTYCREHEIPTHPARMPDELPEFFISMLTDPGDVVFDPFAGSNTTGSVAERLGRQWLAVEANLDFVRGSIGRFSSASRIELPEEGETQSHRGL